MRRALAPALSLAPAQLRSGAKKHKSKLVSHCGCRTCLPQAHHMAPWYKTGCLELPALPIALLHLTTQELLGKLWESLIGGDTQMRALSVCGVWSSCVVLDAFMHHLDYGSAEPGTYPCCPVHFPGDTARDLHKSQAVLSLPKWRHSKRGVRNGSFL